MSRRRRQDPPFSLFAFQDIITSVTGIMVLLTLIVTLALITRELGAPEVQSLAVAADVSSVLDETYSEISKLQGQVETRAGKLAEFANLSPSQVRRDVHDLQQQTESLGIQADSLKDKVDKTEKERRRWKAKQFDLGKVRKRMQELQQDLERLRKRRQLLKQEDRLIYNPQQSSGKTAWLIDVDGERLLAARVGVSEAPRQFNRVADFLGWAQSRDASREYFVLLVRPGGIDAYYRILVTLAESGYDVGIDLIDQNQTVIDPATGAGDKG